MALIMGNGASRKKIDTSSIRDKAYVIGCNAYYRDDESDLLVTNGQEIFNEVIFSGFPVHKHINNPGFDPNKGVCAGSLAIEQAGRRGFVHVYVIGFDSIFGSSSNIFYRTPCYENVKVDTAIETFRLDYIDTIMGHYKYSSYNFIIPDTETPKYKFKSTNAKIMTVSEFNKLLGINVKKGK